MTGTSLTHRILNGLRAGGLRWLGSAIGHRLFPPRLVMESAVVLAITGRDGLEIGGPSWVFETGRLLPVYAKAARVDNVNFSGQTAWETDLRDGGEFRFNSACPPGRQWIRDAVAL